MTTIRSATLLHEAFFYADDDTYLAEIVPFVEAGLAAQEPVLVAVPARNLDLIRRTVGPRRGVWYTDMAEQGRNPGRIIPFVLNAFIGRHPDHRSRIVGEPTWPGRSEDEYPACAQHEALINDAFAETDARILCPYDLSALSDRAIADAQATHPILVDITGRCPSDGYSPAQVVNDYNLPLPAPPDSAIGVEFDLATLSRVRPFLGGEARRAGLDPERVADLLIAVTELATNSIRHAGGTGVLIVWNTRQTLVCEIRDRGWLSDPLSGRLPPSPDDLGGRGLLIVNALCDLVRIHTTPAGTAIRLFLHH